MAALPGVSRTRPAWGRGLLALAAVLGGAGCQGEPALATRAGGAPPVAVAVPVVVPVVVVPVPARVAAIGDTGHLPVALQRAFDPAGDFAPLPAPGPHDWLAAHAEDPQTFEAFLSADTRVPGEARHVLYLLPLGAFPDAAPPVADLARIVGAFYALEVRVLPAVALAEVRATTRLHPETRRGQLLAPDVLAWLTTRLPDDAFGLMAITMEDLYPQASWSFVFGMASLGERVGVQSFARQDPAFFGAPRVDGWRALQLRRATWTLVHEVAHMFGLGHCTYWSCVVAGSNHQGEADARPLHVCPVCLRKLQSSIGFDPATREEALATVLDALGITDEAGWSTRRARWIREGVR